ncbi:glycoside hydrolase family 88/105 protein [Cohnella hashimotonis]|uniref:Glycoside hydrolase family 88 protein n=1 Tax=Cohnella hashimotonis TaxID=2826895 RepID=A0ABT6TA82_9BACL|nr:glycoside hydrolase family 88 protein [Cohnella hashimotonis]MDI4643744.1 glycoside hydrolase family 88 protein [Cohnella hashimotonis]
MTDYIERRESIGYWLGEDAAGILGAVAGRYLGANPEIPFALRAFSADGILQTEEGYYDFDMGRRLPDARHGEVAYACGLAWSDDERSLDAGIMPASPVRFYLNGTLLYRSGAVDEMKPDAKAIVPLLLRKGWNTLLLEMRRTEAGFGCRFGAEEGKVRILQVLAPFAERRETAGWAYSEALPAAAYGEGLGFPDFGGEEADTGIAWLPAREWPAEAAARPNFERIFGVPEGAAAGYAWSKLPPAVRGVSSIWRGWAHGPLTVWLDGQPVIELTGAGAFEHDLPLAFKDGHVLVRAETGEQGWGFELAVSAAESGAPVSFELPAPVHGADLAGGWLYAGPLPADHREVPAAVQSVKRLFKLADGAAAAGAGAFAGANGMTGWALNGPGLRLRPYYENAMLSNRWTAGAATNFGRWDYPLGVTMYGLLQTARELGRPEIADYARAHIDSCTDWYEYSLWDKAAYGFPSINHQLVLVKMLDNCGSFGSAMLEAYPSEGNADCLAIANVIADFIANRLERRDDGAYYRLCVGEYAADTMWADDLYMSAPFLSRYAGITGDRRYLDDAASQFLHYRRYLYMEDRGVMSHVYDFKYGKATRIPWGRGNGWTLFSLSELLERLPLAHEDRPALLAFFRELCAGIAAQQGESGLWRQVLTDPDAYEEASCTAMFAYAFARGVRFGWLDDSIRFSEAALRGWRGLASKAIDRNGNVHGVCSGSRYSFTEDYYKYDLLTVVNDNHGTGIMMLAGVEICRLEAFLRERDSSKTRRAVQAPGGV